MLEKQLLAYVITWAIKITWMLTVYLPLVNKDLHFLKFGDPLHIFMSVLL